MKKIEWEKPKPASIMLNPKANQQPLMPGDPVRAGMQVSAEYKGITVLLNIIEEINLGSFKASVLSFEPISRKRPDDLFERDEVCIDRAHISCLFG